MQSEARRAALEVLRYWAEQVAGRTSTRLPQAADLALLSVPDAIWKIDSALLTIFSQVCEPRPLAYVQQQELRVDDERVFPVAVADTSGNVARAAALTAALDASAGLDDVAALTLLADALEREAWCLASPLAGIPLYDVARVHAALAAAQTASADVLLVGGDVSGVQDFIYTIQAKKAAKQLRGRSLYLQLLAEVIARYVISEAGMPPVNLLYCGGGRFYAVLPASAATLLEELRPRIARILLEYHGIAPYLALAWQPLGGAYPEVWENLHERLNTEKQRRFAKLDEGTLQRLLFEPREAQQFDPAFGPEPDAFEASIEKLSTSLADARLLAERAYSATDTLPDMRTPVAWHEVLREFGLKIWPVAEQSQIHEHGYARRLRAMRDLESSEQKQFLAALSENGSLGRRYTVNVVPKILPGELHNFEPDNDDDELHVDGTMPFSLMAHLSVGVPRWGVLRMDIDDLGSLFGRDRNRSDRHVLASLAETAALSAALSRFFEGYVGALCRRINDAPARKGAVYTVYSGGDDLFIVGSWHLLPDLAWQIRSSFNRYVTGKEGSQSPITLSAGITLHTRKFPIYQAAEEAHEALEAAKRFTRQDGGRQKDALTFLGRTIGWEQYEAVAQLQQELADLVQAGAPRALLITLQALAARANGGRYAANGQPQVKHGPWLWQGAYTLTRLEERSADVLKPRIRAITQAIQEHFADGYLARAGLAARWAQLRLRGAELMERE